MARLLEGESCGRKTNPRKLCRSITIIMLLMLLCRFLLLWMPELDPETEDRYLAKGEIAFDFWGAC